MVNFNGKLVPRDTPFLNYNNRGFQYGDALFETLRIIHGNCVFLEDHYFRLMASMRILRMDIPMDFTLEFFRDELLKTVVACGLSEVAARARITVYRENGGRYGPITNKFGYVIESNPMHAPD